MPSPRATRRFETTSFAGTESVAARRDEVRCTARERRINTQRTKQQNNNDNLYYVSTSWSYGYHKQYGDVLADWCKSVKLLLYFLVLPAKFC